MKKEEKEKEFSDYMKSVDNYCLANDLIDKLKD